jgi:shikimate kinase
MTIALIGYRGSGKSTVARHLAALLGWQWCDADALLEDRVGCSIREIFSKYGEPQFRAWEAELLEELVQQPATVLALGGGVVLRPENRQRLRQIATVWLVAPAEVLWERIQRDPTTHGRRPDLTAWKGLQEVQQLLAEREPLYRACAAWTVDTTHRSPQDVAAAIARWWHEQAAPRGVHDAS